MQQIIIKTASDIFILYNQFLVRFFDGYIFNFPHFNVHTQPEMKLLKYYNLHLYYQTQASSRTHPVYYHYAKTT